MKRNIMNTDSFFTGLLDGWVSSSKIKDFVIKKYFGLYLKTNEAENIWGELNELNKNLVSLGWINQSEVSKKDKSIHKKAIKLNTVHWLQKLENSRVINQGIIAKDAGVSLDLLDKSGEDLKGFTSRAIESLLKLVETKRKKALKAFSPNLTTEVILYEGLRISIMFSRVSRRNCDLRFLNTAIKMNDWYYPVFKSAHTGKLLMNYLLALTEQEITASEMLQ